MLSYQFIFLAGLTNKEGMIHIKFIKRVYESLQLLPESKISNIIPFIKDAGKVQCFLFTYIYIQHTEKTYVR